jgi:hypothetical protein
MQILWKRTIEAWPYVFIAVSVVGFVYLAMGGVR